MGLQFYMEKQSNSVVPPYTNRGVQNTEREGLTACVDWLSATFTQENDVSVIYDILDLDGSQFMKLKSGKYGYKSAVSFGHITLLYDGAEDMGIHLEMTGQGCRYFEQFSGINWPELFTRLLIDNKFNVNITRLDLAIDDTKGYFKIPTLLKYLKAGNVTSKFKITKHIENIIIKTGESVGHTLYFGRPTSQIQVRFYEKDIEQEMKGGLIDPSIKIWNRTEIQARDDRAEAFAFLIANDVYDVGKIVAGTLKNYIQFRKPNEKDSNKSRWEIASFWNKFLGDTDKIKLTQKKVEKTIEKKFNWINHSVTKTLSMLAIAFPEDLELMINDFLTDGYNKLNKEDEHIINMFKSKKLTYTDYINQLEKITHKAQQDQVS